MAVTEQEIHSTKQRFGIIGNSPMLNNAIRVAIQVAPTNDVLITGESGSGKESSRNHPRAKSTQAWTVTAINCGSIPEGTIDSELFVTRKDRFTGAHEARKGYFEATNGEHFSWMRWRNADEHTSPFASRSEYANHKVVLRNIEDRCTVLPLPMGSSPE